MEERRLCDRVLHALELALDQEALEIAEHLARALELSLTRFGGEGKVDQRDLPMAAAVAFGRLDALKRRLLGAAAGR